MYPDADKEDKQFKYAKRKKIPFIVTLNSDGRNYKVKNINTGDANILSTEDLINFNYH